VTFNADVCLQAEQGSLPRPGVTSDADKLLELVNGLASKAADKAEVDEAIVRKFASGAWHGRGCACGWLTCAVVTVIQGFGGLCLVVLLLHSCKLSSAAVWPLLRSARHASH